MSFSASLGVDVSGRQTNATPDLSEPVDNVAKSYSVSLSEGEGAAKGEVIYHRQGVAADGTAIAAGGSLAIDLSSASLKDALNRTIAPTDGKILVIKNTGDAELTVTLPGAVT